ncbi:MAG: ROK family protein [Bacteroidota bacterium]
MKMPLSKNLFVAAILLLAVASSAFSQATAPLKFKNSAMYAGIDIGSKGVKLSVLEIGKNAQKTGTFNVLQESSINTDFISFSDPTFGATLSGLCKLYNTALEEHKIPAERIFTVISSGVKSQAEKENKNSWVTKLIDSFKIKIQDPSRQVAVVDVMQEARLSHLGIIPNTKRYTTFLIDIGSGNTKGGYFPNGNTNDLKLFQINWGTKSVANATDKRVDEDKSADNFSRQLNRVLAGEANTEIVYAVNASGAYNMSDNIAVSGGIAWSVATLLHPEMIDNPVVPVTYNEVLKFTQELVKNHQSFSDVNIIKNLAGSAEEKATIAKEVKRVNTVFDQKSLMSGAGLLLKIMRQFEGIYDKKEFFLVKNGQVGWISAYVDQYISKL